MRNRETSSRPLNAGRLQSRHVTQVTSSEGAWRVTIRNTVRGGLAGLLSLLLILLVTYHGPVAAAEPDGGFSVDDFLGNSIGPRTLVGGPQDQCGWTDNHSMTTGAGTMRVDLRVPDSRGCNYASIGVRWTAPTSVNIEQGGADRIILKYRDVVPNTSSAVVFGLELVDVNGRKATVGGLSRNGGPAGDFLTIRYAPEYQGDVSYLTFQGGFDKSRVKTVTLLIAATSGNTNVSVTFEGIGTNVGEPAYMAPSFAIDPAYVFAPHTETTHSFLTSGVPTPDVSWTGKPDWMTITTSKTSEGRLVTMSGNPGAAYADHSLSFHADVANSLTADATVRAVVPSPVTVTNTAGDTRVAQSGPVVVGTVSATPAATTVTNAGGIPPGTTLAIVGSNLVLNGTPTVAGTYEMTATVGNEFRNAAFARQIIVGEPPHITAPGTQYLVRGEAMTPFAPVITGYPQPDIDITGLPDGLSATAGVISGTPTAASVHTVTVAADNDFGSDAATFDIEVGDRPTLEATEPLALTSGTAIDRHLSTTGSPTSLTVAGLPAGLAATLTSGVVEIVGTPLPPTSPSDAAGTATITVANSFGAASRDIEWVLSAAPIITGGTEASTTVGSALTPLVITITGHPSPQVTVTDPDADGQLLPPGLSIDDSVPGVVTIRGTATGPGVETIRVTADNGVGTAAVHDVTVTALSMPAFADKNPRLTVTQGESASLTVDASGFPTPTLFVSGPLPSWLTFDAASGTFTAAPGITIDGAFGPYRVEASNSAGTMGVDMYVDVTSAPSISAAAPVDVPFGVAVSAPLATVGGYPTPTVEASGLPDGLSLSQTGNIVSVVGTPTAPGGAYTVTLTATNGAGSPAAVDTTVSVTTAPTLSAPSSATFVIGAPESLMPTLGGFPQPTVSATGLPPGIVLDAATGELSGVPTQQGNYVVELTTVGGAPDVTPATATIAILVADPPFLVKPPAPATVTVGVNAKVSAFITRGFPEPTFEAIGLPPGMYIRSTSLIHQPMGAPTASGEYSVLLKVSNAAGSTYYPWSVTVAETPTISVPSSSTLIAGEAMTPIDVVLTGYPTPEVTATGLPPGLYVESDDEGTRITGTPATEGRFVVLLRATNSAEPGMAASVLVLTVGSPPAFGPDARVSVEVGTPVVYPVAFSGDPESVLTTTALPSWLTFDVASRQFTASPTAADAGATSVVIVTAVSPLGSDTIRLTFDVTAPPAASPTTGTVVIDSGTAAHEPLTAVSGYPVPQVTADALPAGLSLDVVAGVLTLTGTTHITGSHDLAITLSNGVGSDVVVNWTIVVNEAASLHTPSDQTLTIGAPVSIPITTSGFPAPVLTVTGLPTGLQWVPGAGGGTITGTPVTEQTSTVLVSAANSSGPPAQAEFTLVTQHAVITVVPGATDVPAGSNISVSASGFQPGEIVDIELHSTPVLLANVQANSRGEVYAVVTIPADTSAGAHHLVLNGATGAIGSVAIHVHMRAVLASTGTSVWTPVTVATGLILAGLALVIVRRSSRAE